MLHNNDDFIICDEDHLLIIVSDVVKGIE